MNIMAICAHPDDELLFGGTIAKFSDQGHKASVLYVTSGDKGHFTIPPDELAQTREKEVSKACNILGAEALFLRVLDHEIYDNLETENKLVEMIRQVDPDIIITLDPNDYERDHWTTSYLATQCLTSAQISHYKTESPAIKKAPTVYYCDTVLGLRFDPEIWIDISDVFERKIQSLRSHESQIKFMMELWETDLIKFMTAQSRFRGFQCNVEYAEAFRRLKVYPRIQPASNLLPR